MENLIKISSKESAKIVYLDNMYMYDPEYLSNMTEDTPIRPVSEKGKIREKVFRMFEEAVEKNRVSAVSGRSADFYGPGVAGSFLTQLVYNNLIRNKSSQWIGRPDVIHTFAYSKDIGKALSLLGNTPDAFNQLWHLPAADEKLTSEQWIKLVMKTMNINKPIKFISPRIRDMLALFIPVLRELKEIAYQFENDYYFNSSKFKKFFNFSATNPDTAVREMVEN